MKYYALWLDATGGRHWDGPYPDNVTAREAVPAIAFGSLIVTPMAAMTPAEHREALRLLGD